MHAAATEKTVRVSAVLGTMSIPGQLDIAGARESLEYFLDAGFDMVDSAIIYQGGKTEMALGERALLSQI